MSHAVLNLKFSSDDFLLILTNFRNHNRFLNTHHPHSNCKSYIFRLPIFLTLNSVSLIVSNATRQDKSQVPFIQFGGSSLEERWFYQAIANCLSGNLDESMLDRDSMNVSIEHFINMISVTQYKIVHISLKDTVTISRFCFILKLFKNQQFRQVDLSVDSQKIPKKSIFGKLCFTMFENEFLDYSLMHFSKNF